MIVAAYFNYYNILLSSMLYRESLLFFFTIVLVIPVKFFLCVIFRIDLLCFIVNLKIFFEFWIRLVYINKII
jgi:hypothetical protein